MPWHAAESSECPASKPWAVIKDADGTVAGCHETEQAAKDQIRALYAKEGKTVDHIALKATTTTTDQGIFEAVISTEGVDREKDVVSAEGMVAALRKWNRPLPLAWHHSTKAEDIFGHIDPTSAHAHAGRVLVSGQVDLDSRVGQEAWRSFKARTVGFSFGYLILEAKKRAGGGRHISALDVFEATATPTPMNNETQVLSTKADAEQQPLPNGFPGDELEGMRGGELKAVWTTAYINDLPDSAFLYIEPGGEKDEDGKTTPRSKRYFPYKNADGSIDLPHLRNALARIPQSNLSQDVKDRLIAKAEQLLANQKAIEDAPAEDPPAGKAKAQDPLRKRSEELELEVLSDGIAPRRPPSATEESKPEPKSAAELKRLCSEQMLEILTG